MKQFLSFGNERFIKSRKRMKEEAEKIGLFDNVIVETETICEEEPFKTISNKIDKKWGTGRGFYWYMWKPYIIDKTLSKLNNDDILFYNDCGMQIFPERLDVVNKFKHLFELVQNKEVCPSGIATFITQGSLNERKEYMYNLVQIFKHFNVEKDESITHTQQCQAGVIIIRKCEESVKIIKNWFNLALENPEYFVGDKRVHDKYKKEVQFKGFRDHRHDQSVWSVLCKLNNVNILQHNLNPIYQTRKRE